MKEIIYDSEQCQGIDRSKRLLDLIYGSAIGNLGKIVLFSFLIIVALIIKVFIVPNNGFSTFFMGTALFLFIPKISGIILKGYFRMKSIHAEKKQTEKAITKVLVTEDNFIVMNMFTSEQRQYSFNDVEKVYCNKKGFAVQMKCSIMENNKEISEIIYFGYEESGTEMIFDLVSRYVMKETFKFTS